MIKELYKEFTELEEELKRCKFNEQLYREQLLIILMNNGGKLRNLRYNDMSIIDYSKISIGISYDACTLYNISSGEAIPIANESEVPLTTKTSKPEFLLKL